MRSAFTVIFRQPAIFFAELTWRWVFNISALLVVFYTGIAYFKSLPVTDADMLGLSGLIPGAVGVAIKHIFHGSGPTLVRLGIVAAFGLGLLWWIAATVGRAAEFSALFGTERPPLRAVGTSNGLRMIMSAVALFAFIGVFLFAANRTQLASSDAMQKFYFLLLPLGFIVGAVWSVVDWYLTIMSFAGARHWRGLIAALQDSADVMREYRSQFLWAGFATGVARFVLRIGGFFVFISLLSAALQSPAIVAWLLIGAFAAVYSAFSAFVHLLRTAAYARVIDFDRELRQQGTLAAVV
jgi:hypothetical protein